MVAVGTDQCRRNVSRKIPREDALFRYFNGEGNVLWRTSLPERSKSIGIPFKDCHAFDLRYQFLRIG